MRPWERLQRCARRGSRRADVPHEGRGIPRRLVAPLAGQRSRSAPGEGPTGACAPWLAGVLAGILQGSVATACRLHLSVGSLSLVDIQAWYGLVLPWAAVCQCLREHQAVTNNREKSIKYAASMSTPQSGLSVARGPDTAADAWAASFQVGWSCLSAVRKGFCGG